ncbi:MAG: LptA/OstA family protein [Bryobacteraceae bacterium]|nr:LptA/OstA family protein [Bryobacteraceae bacterium]
MRAGGEELERVWTEAPGRIEFRPSAPGQPFRAVTGERFTFGYAGENQLESFRATKAETLTIRAPAAPKKEAKPVETRTRSDDLEARFDPATGELDWLRQWGGFEYQEQARRAAADEARLDARTDRIELAGRARVWDETGMTSAPRIRIDQKEDVTVAEGGVASVMRPQEEGGGGLVRRSEPLRATAQRMTAREQNRRILFEGDAVLWQGDMRLRGQRVRIDREQERLEAEGSVVAEIPDERGGAQGRAAARMSVVRAPSLVYDGRAKQALFAGGVVLERPAMTVESRQLRAFFSEQEANGRAETRLERLEADGAVVIREWARGRRRTGRGEHAEYFLAEERMVLRGGNPSVEDEQRGVTRGAVITWFGRQDRMTVDNEGAGPAVSRVKQKGSD